VLVKRYPDIDPEVTYTYSKSTYDFSNDHPSNNFTTSNILLLASLFFRFYELGMIH
jgi:hypothetical protein